MNRQQSKYWNVVALALLLISAAVRLHAHTELVKSEPAAGATVSVSPKQILFWFNEKIDPSVSRIEVMGAAGKVALGPLRVVEEKSLVAEVTGAIASGTYSVAWQTAGADGHIVKGTLDFSVKLAE